MITLLIYSNKRDLHFRVLQYQPNSAMSLCIGAQSVG